MRQRRIRQLPMSSGVQQQTGGWLHVSCDPSQIREVLAKACRPFPLEELLSNPSTFRLVFINRGAVRPSIH